MLPSMVRRWLNRPKKSDPRLLARFFYIDEEVSSTVHELQCLDLRKDAQNYLLLLSQLHNTQEHMLILLEQMLEQTVPTQRRQRDYHMKFPDDLVTDNMTTHLLFAAELMVGGTYIEVEETEGAMLRPLAQELLRSLQDLRRVLREQSLEDPGIFPESAQRALLQYDNLCAEFEFRYMSLLVSVRTPEEIYEQQEVAVLFCETVSRALQKGYLTQEMIDDCEPELMISIPRLAIISGLLIYPDGPLNLQKRPEEMCELFSPFYALLKKIKEILLTLTEDELFSLERALCSASSKDSSVHLSCISDHPIAWSHPTEGGKQPEYEPSSVELSPQCESVTESPQCSSTADIPNQRSVSATSVNCCSQPGVSSSSENTTWVDHKVVMEHCVIGKTTEQLHKPYVRKVGFQTVRTRYRSNRDMLHRLFVCISGTAEDGLRLPGCALCQNREQSTRGVNPASPEWVPDSACNQCSCCCAPFTLLRRRHHCRSCGKIFCSRCSAYTTSLPRLPKTPVRVCSHCFHVHCNLQARRAEGRSQGQE
ncbi:lateral signaling target protein 2 homolog isoform X2 [Spea bombifrons]|uniref:lateral signaling target protein 2 homolog isoform X2 n=1 Tax=Spea bombifrons TaxID=233779 RepID=UPI0023494411|nr:lateral signaling target protein 2 homolog isoform X2 [Spea bombifrons]